ncbi:hypothetical protein AQUCO_01800124v1 [Aquilegia coerulea]|uniref:Uncharacterized protein n=1 Tax=Aquilegia coerulea TaxID=218851 RepID=A0A2G5DK41_AQUCA|nr:hypothetical protein AQUCO_01800124v1 [Aquilegia coerulea]
MDIYMKSRVTKSKSFRIEHCSRLSRLLNVFIQHRNLKEASGVLSVLLKGSIRERFPKENRHKYLAAMELLKKMEHDDVKPIKITQVYEIWIRKNGPMKKCPAKDKFAVELEFVLFCLTHGMLDDAKQATVSMMHDTEYVSDPVLNMILGLIYYELWYACVSEEMKLKSSDIYETPILSDLSGLNSFNGDESTCCNSFDIQGAESPARDDSASSVGNNKKQCIESVGDIQREPSNQSFNPQNFYMEESSETSGSKEDNHDDNLIDTSVFNSRVKHLKSAVYSTPPVWASLLPLVQLLLLGDQVEEAVKELENICQTSNATLPLRIKVILMECFDSKNSIMLSNCYEDTLKKDPTCGHSLTRLINMHKNGDYGLVPLLEMIALHLDATYAACSMWEELASCFLKVSRNDEDQLSVCGYADERHLTDMNMVSKRFIYANSRKSWELRCKWWTKRHFSKIAHVSEMKTGNWELLTCKAACASHLYGPQFEYVISVYSYLEQAGKRDQALFLQLHMKNSVMVSEQLNSEDIIMDEQSCFSN